jgi:hypothetical protein
MRVLNATNNTLHIISYASIVENVLLQKENLSIIDLGCDTFGDVSMVKKEALPTIDQKHTQL